jgi:2-amino-4-hydroxy-6-hydroxymethyldihydropteridine diphosphokinase
VVEVSTDLPAPALMEALHAVEAEFGRTRRERNAPRPIDLDLIDYRGKVAEAGSPILPHPRMADRAFVLLPLRDIAPHWRHPVTGRSLDQLIGRLPAADRRAARPHGGTLCAAPSRLKA